MNKFLQIILFIIGTLLLVAGLLIYGVYPFLWGGPITSLVGFIVIAFYIYINRKSLKESISVRSAKYATNTIVFAVIVFLIISLVNVISLKARYKIDNSSNSVNSLTKQTQDVLKKLDKSIDIYGFIPPKDEGVKQTFKSICENYNYESDGKVNCTIVNPDQKPELAKKFLVSSLDTQVYGVSAGANFTRAEFLSEEDFTSAIIKVTRQKTKLIYFTNEHGEGDISSDVDNGFNKLKYKLESLGYNTLSLALTSLPKVPKDCDVLVILAPKVQMLPSDIQKISNYLNLGGSVLFMVDPLVNINTEKLFADWGIRLGNDVVVDKLSNTGDPFIPVISRYPKHDITRKGNLSIPLSFFNEVRSVMPTGKQKDQFDVIPLLITSAGASFAETDLSKYVEFSKVKYDPGVDIMGPISLACVSTKTIVKQSNPPEFKIAKLAVFGDSDFVSNKAIDFYGNNVLALNLFNWLAGDNDLISLDKATPKPNMISLTNENRKIIYYISLLLIPGIFIFTGGFIWWKKRKK